MYYFLALLAGVVISVMISINGNLTQVYGVYWAAVIIHIVGVLFSLILCIAKGEISLIRKRAPLWAYLGGAIGVLTTLFDNYAFGRISMTSIVALGLLGQSVTSVILDSTGGLGVKKRPVKGTSVIGFIPAAAGIFLMMDNSVSASVIAVILSLVAGITVVLSRTVNSRLSGETSPLVGSFINHVVGLPICFILALLLQQFVWVSLSGIKPWIFLGGTLGVLTVVLFNITVPRLPAFQLTLLSFVSQVFTGIALDLMMGQEFSNASFIGGIIITAGLLANMVLNHMSQRRHKSTADD